MSKFFFKGFSVDDAGCGMKICSDSVLLAAWFASSYAHARSVLDVGTGSGVLALLCANICTEAHITGVEIDKNAAEAATQNFSESPWEERLSLKNIDFNDFTIGDTFDLIISNPPYFTTGEISTDSSRALARHQYDGLTYATLIRKSAKLLDCNGHLGIISPAEFENDIIFEAEMACLKLRRLLRVKTSPRKDVTRLLWDFSTTDGYYSEDKLSIRNADSSYSDAYRRLVEPYYLKI